MRFDVAGIDRQRLLVTRYRVLVAAKLGQHVAEIGVSFAVPRVESECVPEFHDGFIGSAEKMQYVAIVVACLGICRLDGEGPFVVLLRLFEPSQPLQGVAQIVMGLGEVRPDGKRSLIVLDRIFGAPETRQDDPEMMVRLGRARFDLERAPKPFFGVLELSLLQTDEAQMIERTEMPIVALQHGSVQPFRVPQTPLFVEGHRLVE
jgi:hypothetical protein